MNETQREAVYRHARARQVEASNWAHKSRSLYTWDKRPVTPQSRIYAQAASEHCYRDARQLMGIEE
jgi:hypothetical protein